MREKEHTTVTVSLGAPLFGPGDYVSTDGRSLGRVTHSTATTITYRAPHRWRWLEALHCWYEERVKWPLVRWRERR